uniref:PTC1-like winged helix-turn-helix domain-containing protein n=1 Tax=Leersia perrieri TaxID=77586 RepID=A0A0D9Y1K9_9ORYZ
MSAAIHYSRVLRRRAVAGDDDLADAVFWSAGGGAPLLYDFSQQQQEQEDHKPPLPVSPPPSPTSLPVSPPSAAAECLLTLQQCSGVVRWGVRKRVRYVGRHLTTTTATAAEEEEESSTKSTKKMKTEIDSPEQEKKQETAAADEKETSDDLADNDDHKPATTTATATEKKKKRNRKRNRATVAHRRRARAKKIRRADADADADEKKKKKNLPSPKSEKLEAAATEEDSKSAVAAALPPARGGMVDRWKATRYATAEASLLRIMRARGAVAGKPISRGELRKEARAHIGDTGLLDHLLRHIADKVAAGGDDRFRRRHNAAGALEYWLEPAGLAAVRRDAGVDDPYWVPPPGWKPGDPVSPEAYAMEAKRQVEQLAAELAGVKRHMDQLTSNVMQVSKEMKSEADKSYNSWQEKYACMEKANGNLEKKIVSLEEKYNNAREANGKLKEELLFLKEKYGSVVENNTRMEQQMAALSTSVLCLKDDLLWLNTEEQHRLEKEEADLYVKEPWDDNDDDKQKDDAAAAAILCAANQQPAGDGDGDGDDVSNGSSGKRASRKCSLRITKPQATFQWPTTSLPVFSPELAAPTSPPMTPTVAAGAGSLANFATMDELYEYMIAGGLPTPPSASSTNNAGAGKLPLLPSPASPSTTCAAWLRHTDAPAACRASPAKTMAVAGLDAGAGGGNVGTELALATATY